MDRTAEYYHPNAVHVQNASKVDVPLPARNKDNTTGGELTLGHGNSEAEPLAFYLEKDEDKDVGYIRIFLTTSPTVMRLIPQDSPFRRTQRIDELVPGTEQDTKISPEKLDEWWDVKTL